MKFKYSNKSKYMPEIAYNYEDTEMSSFFSFRNCPAFLHLAFSL